MNTEQPETHQYPRHSHSDPEYGTTAPHFSEAKISIYHMWSSRFFSNTGECDFHSGIHLPVSTHFLTGISEI